MISKQKLKQLEFKDMFEYYDYVIESKINGNYAQTKELIKDMNDKQFKDFLSYYLEYDNNIPEHNTFLNMRFEK